MSTPLMWKAFELYQNLFGILYKHPISILVAKKTCKVERRWRKLIPFYAATSLEILHCFLIAYIVLTWRRDKPGAVSVQIIYLQLEMFCITFLCSGLNYSMVKYGPEFFECFMPMLWDFDLKYRGHTNPQLLKLKNSLIKLLLKGESEST